jgi:Mlc titration factor MtfA (ptsG expression regulator)
VIKDTRQHKRDRNVVFHEFAHKIDMLDDVVDGTPPISDPDQRDRWIEVCTASFKRLRNGTSTGVLRDYAGVNPGEFFAVASEVFFSAPQRLWAGERDLYEVQEKLVPTAMDVGLELSGG